MAFVQVHCPDCHSTDVVQYGKQANGTQRYHCNNRDCPRTIFPLTVPGQRASARGETADRRHDAQWQWDAGYRPGPEGQFGHGYQRAQKKEPVVKQVNARLLHTLDPEQVDIVLRQVEQAEMDEMWSFVGSKSQQRWLWHAIDHDTGQILAYVFGTREDETFLQLKELLAPFGITHFYTDGWGAYRRHLDPSTHTVGKQQTQKIERKHLTFRTRIKRLTRKTICFSRSVLMHDLVIGLFINRYAFGYAV